VLKDQRNQGLTRMLFICGVVAGPLFIAAALVQDYTRAGFDPRIDPLSLLSLGDWGWVQILNFSITGLLNIAFAVGLWRRLHPGGKGIWSSLLIGAYGVGLVGGGIFQDDPAYGFPPGATTPPQLSWHGILHDVSGTLVFMSLAAALFVFGRYFQVRGEGLWSWYCLLSGFLVLVFFFFGTSLGEALEARFLRLGVLFGWGAASAIAMHFLASDSARVHDNSAVKRPVQGAQRVPTVPTKAG
jgi:hypothetical protein